MVILAWCLAALASLTLALTLLNLAGWPRGRGGARREGASVSVLIPARNEEAHIEACVRAAFASEVAPLEVVVCDDHSTDKTPEILEKLTREFVALRVIQGRPLPEGVVGKPHACAQLAEAARGELLLYVDADTVLSPEGVGRLVSLLESMGAGLVTAVPRQVTVTLAERVVLPLLHLTYTNWLPIPLVWRSRDPRFLAANGQLLAVRREVYEAVGGFWAVSRELVDDMAFCRLVKRSGHRVVFADGFEMARCRMYGSAREVWEGFSKNIYEGIGGHPLGLLAVLALFGGTYLGPLVMLGAAPWAPSLWAPALVGAGALAAMRAALCARHRQSVLGALLHPVGIVALLAMAINSFVWTRTGRLRWRGRVYAARARRVAP